MIELIEKDKCTGCSACMSVCPKHAISMNADREGFLYPYIDKDSCIECGICLKTCPIINEQKKNEVIKSCIAINKNLSQRRASASGGIFSVLASWVLEKGGVVFGASYDNDLIVKHIAIESVTDLHKLQMSKYVQSDLNQSFEKVKSFLSAGRIVLFSGTPCQVAGLKAFMKKDSDKLILLDVVCHGVPSPKLFEDYKTEVRTKYGLNIENIFFRSKIIGHHLSTISIVFSNGRLRHSTRLIKSYPRLWFSGYISRPSCYACSFKEEDRVSDFTLFDSFKSSNEYKFKDDDLGLSNVYVRTKKGIEIWNHIKKSIDYVYTDSSITSKNDGDMIYESAKCNEKRKDFWDDYNRLTYPQLIEKYIPYSNKEMMLDIIKRLIVKFRLNQIDLVKKILLRIKK